MHNNIAYYIDFVTMINSLMPPNPNYDRQHSQITSKDQLFILTKIYALSYLKYLFLLFKITDIQQKI